MEKISKFSYIPGILQLTLIPLILYFLGQRNFYVFNSFRIFDNFNQHTSVKTLKLEAKPGVPGCETLGQEQMNAYNSIQKKINFRSSFPMANFNISEADRAVLERCFSLSVYELRVDKYEYYNSGAVMEEILLWTTKPKE